MPLRLSPTFRDDLAHASRTLFGVWACSGSSLVADICAGAGMDWMLIDMEHSPNSLESVLAQLQAVSAYPTTPIVRVPSNDAVVIKQVLDVGAQNILVPMVSTPDEARAAVAATHYPPRGRRGVGSALARSARWNRVDNYLADASTHVSLHVQIETVQGVELAAEIAAVDGIDGVFLGPSDLAASFGLLGQQTHPDVLTAVIQAADAVISAGKPAGVNAFDPVAARTYANAGMAFILVGADVAIIARGTEQLAADFVNDASAARTASY